jgi:hypothetical protein
MKRLLAVAFTATLLLTGIVIAFPRTDAFPHEKHAKMFPLCIGCHEGVPVGNAARAYPAPETCVGCHDGTEQKKVDWRAPTPKQSNLKFSHPVHDRVTAATGEIDCSTCHTVQDTARMAVVRAASRRCFDCHAHETRDHFTDARCSTCHVPVAGMKLAAAKVAALPVPASHKQPGFLERLHGDEARANTARCEVCHTRELCTSCHLDAGRAEIKAIAAAGPGLELPVTKARYFEPESHKRAEWIDVHGAAARTDIADCAACHTRESCSTCHTGPKVSAIISGLAPARAAAAPGVPTTRRAPSSHAAPFFDREHGTVAATGQASCTSCHARAQCEQCHSSVRQMLSRTSNVRNSTPYHAPNFMERHPSAAYSRKLECANCHETSRFCRDCHERRGMGSTGRLEAGFHDVQPFWLLNHGKAARQGMESCASCHKQTDCMQCHSALGAFRVNPHGPGFDAARVQKRNAKLCFACHLTDPLTKSTP